MKRIVTVLFALVVTIALLLSCAPLASAEQDSMKVIITINKTEFDSGDNVPFVVHVFDKSEYVAPSKPPTVKLYSGLQDGNYNKERDVPVSLVQGSTGQYEGTFDIFDSDGGQLLLQADATYAKETPDDVKYNSDSTSVWIHVGTDGVEKGLNVEGKIRNYGLYPFEPGEKVELEFSVKYNGDLDNADKFELTLENVYGARGPEDLPFNNPSDGIYVSAFSIPADMNENALYVVRGKATMETGGSSNAAETYTDEVYFSVDFYNIWYHNVSKTDTKTKFELWVADMDGKAVAGAELMMNYSFFNTASGREETNFEKVITDLDGKAEFVIKYPNVDDNVYISVRGYAKFEDKSQEYTRGIYIDRTGDATSSQGAVNPYGFDVVDKNESESLFAGEGAVRNYQAYVDSNETEDAAIYYYAVSYNERVSSSYYYEPTPKEIISYGKKTTDRHGRFKLELEPENDNDIFVTFETATGPYPSYKGHNSTDNKKYDEDYDYIQVVNRGEDIYSDKAVGINVGGAFAGLKIGGKTKVSVKPGEELEEEVLFAIWYIGSVEDPTKYNPDWEPWSGLGREAPLVKDGGSYVGEILIPEFLPKDIEYTVYASYIDETSGEGHINHLSLKKGEAKSTSASNIFVNGIGSVPWVVIIIIIVTVGILLLFFVMKFLNRPVRFKRYKSPPKEAGPEYPQSPPGPPEGLGCGADQGYAQEVQQDVPPSPSSPLPPGGPGAAPGVPQQPGEQPPPPSPIGHCIKCWGRNLAFMPDGTGRCNDCNHEFWWDQSKAPPR